MNLHVRDNELYLKEVVAGTNADKLPTEALATDAVTQIGAAAAANAISTTSDTNVDVTNMSVTLATLAGSDLLVIYSHQTGASTTQAAIVSIDYDGADTDIGRTDAAGRIPMVTWMLYSGVTAASHTIKANWRREAASGTCYVDWRRLLVVELKK